MENAQNNEFLMHTFYKKNMLSMYLNNIVFNIKIKYLKFGPNYNKKILSKCTLEKKFFIF